MFFIGATGQLLTLLLTVLLPFMLLVSGHQNIETQTTKHNFEVEHISNIEITFENNSSILAPDFYFELQKQHTFFEKSVVLKYPLKKLLVKPKTLCLNTSGNKAPPALICFSC